ncbi:hypothetical protein [Zobellia laminariae]|uniref:hypothetical protein n=1 Tax=Zobellia laminariae TaxID=248906 RepID=UPI0026F45AFB|nr:hypothetical protein [Zobellia laminariae]WKX76584.1 hypothetical protein Q5W13_24300 [Zobellia laminariae]
MKKTRYIFCGLALMAMASQAQEKKIRKADTKFTNYSYASAIQSYEDLRGRVYGRGDIQESGQRELFERELPRGVQLVRATVPVGDNGYRPGIHVPVRPDLKIAGEVRCI